jgi:competence protein ComEC
MLPELNLFDSKRDYYIFFALFFLILFTNIALKYHTFTQIKSHKIYQTTAKVINQYEKTKRGKSYIVLKLRSFDGFTFYTTSREDLRELYGDSLLLKVVTKNLAFLDMFKNTYLPTFDIRLIKKDRVKKRFLNFIAFQHNNPMIKELFQALFLAKPISKELRQKVSNLGISHLIAISGFHLGVLFFILYYLLEKIYKFFQDRYFPYRNRQFDLTIMVAFLLFWYLYLLGFVPPLVRSYVMLLVGFYLYDRYFKIISFEVLFVAVMIILAFIPEFFFNIGFWFSVSGVFFIYYYLYYFSHLKSWQMVLTLNIFVYLAMLPVVHFIFYKFTYLQLLSPLLSIGFILFYPLELFLHLIGEGGLLDRWIVKLLNLKTTAYEIKTPLWFLVVFFISLFFFYKINSKHRKKD